MKVKQTVSAKYQDLYIGWSNLQFTDPGGNEIHIDVTDNQLLDIAGILGEKALEITSKRAEKEKADE